MKRIINGAISVSLILGMAISSLYGCSKKEEERIKVLEDWRETVDQQLNDLSVQLAKLSRTDYVTGVTPLEDGSGYTISFKASPDLTVRNGEDGDLMFQSIDNSQPEWLTITLADGKTYKIMKASELYVKFESNEPFAWTPENKTVTIVLSPYLKEEQFSAIVARTMLISDEGIAEGEDSGQWIVKVTPPVFNGGLYTTGSAKVTLTPKDPGAVSLPSILLKVTMMDDKGREYSASRKIVVL